MITNKKTKKNEETEKSLVDKKRVEEKNKLKQVFEETKTKTSEIIKEAVHEVKSDVETKKLNKRRWKIRILVIVLVLILLGVVFYIFRDTICPFITDSEYRNQELEIIKDYGFAGKLIILGVFVLQVILFVIHYGPIAIITGSLFGPWWTLVLSTLGSSIGVIIVWYMSKKMGKKFIKNFVDVDALTESYSPTKVKRNLFLLSSAMLFPGAPKAIFAYVAPFTGIKIWQFLIINAVCKMPMTLLNASIGYGLVSGHWLFTIITGAVSLVTSLIGFYFARKYNKVVKAEKISELKSKKY